MFSQYNLAWTSCSPLIEPVSQSVSCNAPQARSSNTLAALRRLWVAHTPLSHLGVGQSLWQLRNRACVRASSSSWCLCEWSKWLLLCQLVGEHPLEQQARLNAERLSGERAYAIEGRNTDNPAKEGEKDKYWHIQSLNVMIPTSEQR